MHDFKSTGRIKIKRIGSSNVSTDEMGNNGQIGHFFCLLTLFLVGAILFLLGFFPASYSKIESEQKYEDFMIRPTKVNNLQIEPPLQQHDAFILFLIDALRMNFANSSTMPMAENFACQKFKLHVDIPTVTMPRLKSITTGTLSNFIDIALNVGHTEQLDDSLIHRLKRRGDIISFVGDRTWTQLFPNEFTRQVANNDSFYVNDFYEGDKNVTKVLNAELEFTDWTLLILHYLGLDHIGHVEGSESAKIQPKLKEMDEAIGKILNHRNYRNLMLMVTGDHGMANGGGHGGNTMEESYVPLYVYKQNCTKPSVTFNEYNQIDLTPTLAILLSLDIPKSSIGCLIPEMLESLSWEDQLYSFYYNAFHLLNRARIKFGRKAVNKNDYSTWFLHARLSHQNYLLSMRTEGVVSSVQFHKAKLGYIRVAKEISKHLSESLVKFDYGLIFFGLALTTSTTLHGILSVMFFDMNRILKLSDFKFKQMMISFVLAGVFNIGCHYFHYIIPYSLLSFILLLIPTSATIYFSIDIFRIVFRLLLPERQRLKASIPMPLSLLVGLAVHTFSLGSSSYIEYEELVWNYLGISLLIYTTLETLHKRIQKHIISENVGIGDVRDLYIMLGDNIWNKRKSIVMLIIVTWLSRLDRNFRFKNFLLVFSLFLLCARLRKFNTLMQKAIGIVMTVFIYAFHCTKHKIKFLGFENHFLNSRMEVPLVFMCYCCIMAIMLFGYRRAVKGRSYYNQETPSTLLKILQTNFTCVIYTCALLQKPHNVVLMPAMLIVLDETYSICGAYSPSLRMLPTRKVYIYKVVLTFFVAKMFYFYQGNSNSLSSIDLNPGYIGQTSYSPVIVGILVTLNTYSAEIIAFLYLIVHTLRTHNASQDGMMSLPLPSYLDLEVIDSLVIPLYAALTMLPVAFYLCLMVGFRYHLFIYSVFSPKVLYDCYAVLVFYLMFTVTSLYFSVFYKSEDDL